MVSTERCGKSKVGAMALYLRLGTGVKVIKLRPTWRDGTNGVYVCDIVRSIQSALQIDCVIPLQVVSSLLSVFSRCCPITQTGLRSVKSYLQRSNRYSAAVY